MAACYSAWFWLDPLLKTLAPVYLSPFHTNIHINTHSSSYQLPSSEPYSSHFLSSQSVKKIEKRTSKYFFLLTCPPHPTVPATLQLSISPGLVLKQRQRDAVVSCAWKMFVDSSCSSRIPPTSIAVQSPLPLPSRAPGIPCTQAASLSNSLPPQTAMIALCMCTYGKTDHFRLQLFTSVVRALQRSVVEFVGQSGNVDDRLGEGGDGIRAREACQGRMTEQLR